jgi:tetratricopeptide (TPR) repeat protein
MRFRVTLGCGVLLWMMASLVLAAGGGDGWDSDAWSSKSKEFRAGYEAIEQKDYRKAVEWFTRAAAADPMDADAANFLGYAHRKLGRYEEAIKFYGRALELNPKHRGALEYLGEAYLELKDLAMAKEQLAKLDKICWLGCKEYSDLKAAIREFEKKSKS